MSRDVTFNENKMPLVVEKTQKAVKITFGIDLKVSTEIKWKLRSRG